MTASLILLALAQAAPAPALSAADRAAAFKAAGFTQVGGQWRSDCYQPDSGPYEPGAIAQVRDLNGDGRPEAIITEGGSFCYGHTGTGFALVGKQADGSWRRITGSIGIPTILATKGAGGWLDIEIGGPGFCFPVWRWNGREYAVHRHQYEGKPCRPPRP